VTVVAYVPDLMDRSRVSAAAPGAVLARSPRQLPAAVAEAGGATVTVVVDLSRPGVLEVIPALVATGARVVGFGSHVDRAVLEGARAAGCAQVLARSAFFGRIGELLG